jgi:hypothetical protein
METVIPLRETVRAKQLVIMRNKCETVFETVRKETVFDLKSRNGTCETVSDSMDLNSRNGILNWAEPI